MINPEAKLFIQEIFPRYDINRTKKIRLTNNNLKLLCHKHDATLMPSPDFSGKDYTRGGLHLNENGKDLLRQSIGSFIKERISAGLPRKPTAKKSQPATHRGNEMPYSLDTYNWPVLQYPRAASSKDKTYQPFEKYNQDWTQQSKVYYNRIRMQQSRADRNQNWMEQQQPQHYMMQYTPETHYQQGIQHNLPRTQQISSPHTESPFL